MLIDLLDQVEKLGPRLPVELHVKCRQYRSTIGLPPNVVSDPNWNSEVKQEEKLPHSLEVWSDGNNEESADPSEVDAIEY